MEKLRRWPGDDEGDWWWQLVVGTEVDATTFSKREQGEVGMAAPTVEMREGRGRSGDEAGGRGIWPPRPRRPWQRQIWHCGGGEAGRRPASGRGEGGEVAELKRRRVGGGGSEKMETGERSVGRWIVE